MNLKDAFLGLEKYSHQRFCLCWYVAFPIPPLPNRRADVVGMQRR
jgi:hypothetical protein